MSTGKVKDNIRYIFNKSKMSQKEIEEKLDLSSGYISKILSDKENRNISLELICKVADMFEISIDSIVNENLEAEDVKLGSNKDKEKRIFNKIIEDTLQGKIDWQEFALRVSGTSEEHDCLYSYIPYENVSEFYSKLGRKIDIDSKGFIGVIKEHPYIEMVIVNLPAGDDKKAPIPVPPLPHLNNLEKLGAKKEMAYEVYIIKDGQALLSATSHNGDVCNRTEYEVLDRLWKKIDYYVSFGKDQSLLSAIYDEILSEDEELF